jgi:transposase
VIAIVDAVGNIIAPLPLHAANEPDIVKLGDGLTMLKRMVKAIEVSVRGSILNLDAGFDSKANRKRVWNSGMRPNIKTNPRNRRTPKRGRKRWFDEEVYKQRFTIERSFGWEDKFRRVLLRFERIAENHMGFKLLAFTLINLRWVIS